MPEFLSPFDYKRARELSQDDLIEAVRKDSGNISLLSLLCSRLHDNYETFKYDLVMFHEQLVAVLLHSTLARKYPELIVEKQCELARAHTFFVRNHQRAILVCESALEGMAGAGKQMRCYNYLVYLYLSHAVSLENSNRKEEAKEVYIKALELADEHLSVLSNHGGSDRRGDFCFSLVRLSDLPEDKRQYSRQALRYFHEALISYGRNKKSCWFNIACAHSLLGNLPACLEAARIALCLGNSVEDFKNDPDFNNVREAQEFKDAMKANSPVIQPNQQRNYIQNRLAESENADERSSLTLILKRFDHMAQLAKMLIPSLDELLGRFLKEKLGEKLGELEDMVKSQYLLKTDSQHHEESSNKLANLLDECEYKSDFFIYDFQKESALNPLSAACKKGNINFLRILLQYGVNPEFDECSVFFTLLENDSEENIKALEILIEHGLDVNTEPYHHQPELGGYICEPLLIHALRAKKAKLALALIQAGARLDITSYAGKTPLELAVQYGLSRVVEWILEKRPDLPNPISCPTVYYGSMLKEATTDTPHYRDDSDIKKYYKDEQISECGKGAAHMLTLDLTQFPDFPDSVKKWKTYTVVFSPPCEDCDGGLTNRVVLERQKDGTLKRTDVDLKLKKKCSPPEEVKQKKFLELHESSQDQIKWDNSETVVVGGFPKWMQYPEWPEDYQEPFFFVGQFYDQDYWDKFFLFLGTESGKQVIVYQYT